MRQPSRTRRRNPTTRRNKVMAPVPSLLIDGKGHKKGPAPVPDPFIGERAGARASVEKKGRHRCRPFLGTEIGTRRLRRGAYLAFRRVPFTGGSLASDRSQISLRQICRKLTASIPRQNNCCSLGICIRSMLLENRRLPQICGKLPAMARDGAARNLARVDMGRHRCRPMLGIEIRILPPKPGACLAFRRVPFATPRPFARGSLALWRGQA
jgi:hypothetical protein